MRAIDDYKRSLINSCLNPPETNAPPSAPFPTQVLHAVATICRILGIPMPAAVRHGGMGTGISEASKRVPIFSFATQGGKQVSSYFRQGNWVQALEARTGSDPVPCRLTGLSLIV